MKYNSLLRNFDINLANKGELLGYKFDDDNNRYRFIEGPDDCGYCCVVNIDIRILDLIFKDQLYMIPLFWLDNKPVYKEDKLWDKVSSQEVLVKSLTKCDEVCLVELLNDGVVRNISFQCLSWTKPEPELIVKNEGWININYLNSTSKIYKTDTEALNAAAKELLYVKTIKIEW